MTTDEAFDELRLTTSDAIREVGSALQHARQALDMAENGVESPDDWAAPADALEDACQILGECEQIARKQANRKEPA